MAKDSDSTESQNNRAEKKACSTYNSSEPPSKTARRYRTSEFFLRDQLRCSEAIEDFRSVKNLMSDLPAFSLRRAFQFASVPAGKP